MNLNKFICCTPVSAEAVLQVRILLCHLTLAVTHVHQLESFLATITDPAALSQISVKEMHVVRAGTGCVKIAHA